jgi:alpha-galactosidase
MVYGTPLYMSPEQAHGERVDQRSDLFSLGSVMYAMCTGRPPFRGDTGLAVLKRVCEETPRPIREIVPEVPEWLVAIIATLHAKKPDDRFASAREVADLLGRCLSELQGTGRVESLGETVRLPRPTSAAQEPAQGKHPKSDKRPSPGRRRVAAAAAILVLLAGFGLAEAAGVTSGLATHSRLFSPDDAPVVEGGSPAPKELKPAAPPAKYKSGAKMHVAGATDRPVKVFVLAGDSNMAGRVAVSLLKYQANQAETKERFQHLIKDGKWVVREDVWIKYFKRKGNLTVGFGQEQDRFGPELEFGHVVGDHFDEQVLLIKTSWGGNTLSRDLRSPSSGLPPQEVLERERKELLKFNAKATLADVERTYGALYRQMLKEVRETLANLGEHFPGYRGQGFEIAGFVYFSGWNDMIEANPFYADLLANLIRDVRADLKAPNLPFVIGQLGVDPDNVQPGSNDGNFRIAQAAAASLPEFKGNVKLVETDPFWDREAHAVLKKGVDKHRDEWDKVGSDAGYHYLGSARTFCLIGRAFGEAILELRRSGARS